MRKFKFTIYHFDKKGQLDFTQKLTTQKMDLKSFERTLRNEIIKYKNGTYCYEIHDIEASIYISKEWK